MSVAIQFTQNFLGVQPECSQVCKFVKEFRSYLLGVCTARIEIPCKLVEVAAHLAALSKQGGNSGQGFFAAACNDDRFLDLDVVDGAADESGEGKIQEFCSTFEFQFLIFRYPELDDVRFVVRRVVVLGIARGVEKEERRVNAKSLLGVLSLGIVGGTTIRIIADGADEQAAVDGLIKLVESGFAE